MQNERHYQKGFAFTELLIAVTLIGLVIVAGFTVYTFGLKNFKLGQDQTKIQSDLRYIAETISKEMRTAEEVEILGQVPQPQSGYTDIYFEDETVYIRRNEEPPVVLSVGEAGQLMDMTFSNQMNSLIDFELNATLNKGTYSIDSSVKPLNLSGGIKGETSGKIVRFKNPFIVPDIDFAVFTYENIKLINGPTIEGNVITNTNGSGAVSFEGGTRITKGNLVLGVGANVENTISYTENTLNKHIVDGEVYVQTSNREFPMPVFPDAFPEPKKNEPDELIFGWNPIPEEPLTEGGWYKSITVFSRVQVDVGDEDLIFRTDKLDLRDTGDIVINRQGKGKVYFYVDEALNMGSDGTINWLTSLEQSIKKDDQELNLADIDNPGDPSDVIIFYRGDKDFTVAGGTRLNATVFLKDKPIELTAGGGITGNIVTGTTEDISVSGGAEAIVRVLYAPNAKVTFSGGGTFYGSIIADSLDMTGGTKITYDPQVSDALHDLTKIITFQ